MKKMTTAKAFLCALFITVTCYGQRFDQLDDAPVDIAYLRKGNADPLVRVVYGRPTKETDKVFGEQVPYDEVWRTGANESTEIKFYKNVLFGGKVIKAGTYVLHTIPGKKDWTIILNSKTDSYGAFFYDPSKDVARVKVAANEDMSQSLESFSIAFTNSFKETFMVLGWDTTRVNIPLQTDKNLLAKI